jgi:hypothetical protein
VREVPLHLPPQRGVRVEEPLHHVLVRHGATLGQAAGIEQADHAVL